MLECIPTTVTNAFVSILKTEQTLNLQITEAIRVFQQFLKKARRFFIQQGEYTHQVDMLLKSHEMRYTFVKSSTDELKSPLLVLSCFHILSKENKLRKEQ